MVEALKGMKVYPVWELLEMTDFSEWDALSKKDKEMFQLIISAGTIYFTDGASVRNVLLNLFPVGTITGNKFRLM